MLKTTYSIEYKHPHFPHWCEYNQDCDYIVSYEDALRCLKNVRLHHERSKDEIKNGYLFRLTKTTIHTEVLKD